MNYAGIFRFAAFFSVKTIWRALFQATHRPPKMRPASLESRWSSAQALSRSEAMIGVAAILLLAGAGITPARAQLVRFPGGAAPVLASPSVTSFDATGRPGVVHDGITGRDFIPAYDSSGRLISLKSNKGANAFDIRSILYAPDGRIMSVRFGNLYAIKFDFQSNGIEEVLDVLGGIVIRSPSIGGQYMTTSVTDPTGQLVSTIRRFEQLLAHFGHTLGLSSTALQ